MKKTVPFIAALLLSSPALAVVPGGIVANGHQWPGGQTFDKVSFYLKVDNDGGLKSNYFWANQFHFKEGDGGYIGLQNRSSSGHAFKFSIWKATEWKSGSCSQFGHEGEGVQCDLIYNWEKGVKYRIDVEKKENLVIGSITNTNNNDRKIIAEIIVPGTFQKMYATSSFVEEYSQGNGQLSSCYSMGEQRSVFERPVAFIVNGNEEKEIVPQQRTQVLRKGSLPQDIEPMLTTRTYGNCNDAYIVTSSCTTDSCINTIKDLKSVPSANVSKVEFANNSDIAAESISKIYNENDVNGKKKIITSVIMTDGHWAKTVTLPVASSSQWNSIYIENNASYSTSINHSSSGAPDTVSKGQKVLYVAKPQGSSWVWVAVTAGV